MLKSSHNQIVGRLGETLVAHSLERRGFKVIDRNVHTKYGEVDLIVEKNSCIVFVEVKTRLNHARGYPEEGFTLYKRQNFYRSVLALLDGYVCGKTWSLLLIGVDLDMRRKKAHLRTVELDE